jgi:hypothetical protein
VRVLLCMKIQPYAAPKLVIKTATTARDLFETEALSSAGAARGRRSAVGRLFCSSRECDVLAVYSLLASASARWRWSSIFGKVWRANSLSWGSEPFSISYRKSAAFPFW